MILPDSGMSPGSELLLGAGLPLWVWKVQRGEGASEGPQDFHDYHFTRNEPIQTLLIFCIGKTTQPLFNFFLWEEGNHFEKVVSCISMHKYVPTCLFGFRSVIDSNSYWKKCKNIFLISVRLFHEPKALWTWLVADFQKFNESHCDLSEITMSFNKYKLLRQWIKPKRLRFNLDFEIWWFIIIVVILAASLGCRG